MRPFGPVAITIALSLLALGAMFFHAQSEQLEREGIERRVQALQARLDALEERTTAMPGAQPASAGASIARAPQNARGPLGAAAGERTSAALRVSDGVEPAPRVAANAESELLAVLESQDPDVQERIRKVVADQQLALRDQERERRQAAWEERTNKRLETLAREASLTPQQVDGLFAILTASRDTIGEAMRAARDTHDFESVDAQIETAERQADTEARALLNGRQYEAYTRMRAEQERRRWGRRDGAREAQPAAPERGR